MNLAFLILLQAQSAAPVAPPPAQPAPAVAPAAEPAEPEAPPVEPWDGSYAEGLREIRRLAEKGETDAAVVVAERLIAPGTIARQIEDLTRAEGWRPRVGRALESVADRLDLLGPPPPVRAEAQFARGVALDLGARAAQDEDERALRRQQGRLAFESARLLAGPGALRLDATYQQGWIQLGEAEELRAKIPEISGQPAAPPPPVAAPIPGALAGAAPPPPPDPLALARAAYLSARERFIERLRLEWRDPDTQANVELIQKRLRELDEIEKQRKQDEQKKQDEKKDEQQQDQKQDPKQDEKQDQQKPEDPKKQDPGEDKKEQPDPKEQEPKPDPKDEKQPEPKPADAQNVQAMSKEEMMQLLERLERIEEVQRELQEKLKRMRRTSVEKDW